MLAELSQVDSYDVVAAVSRVLHDHDNNGRSSQLPAVLQPWVMCYCTSLQQQQLEQPAVGRYVSSQQTFQKAPFCVTRCLRSRGVLELPP